MRYLRLFLDNSLDVAVALARVVAMLAWLLGVAAGFGLVWAPADLRPQWIGTLVLGFTVGLTAGYLGFYLYGNEEWRRNGQADDRATAVRND